jgi:hypothetical protein
MSVDEHISQWYQIENRVSFWICDGAMSIHSDVQRQESNISDTVHLLFRITPYATPFQFQIPKQIEHNFLFDQELRRIVFLLDTDARLSDSIPRLQSDAY